METKNQAFLKIVEDLIKKDTNSSDFVNFYVAKKTSMKNFCEFINYLTSILKDN